MPSDPFVWTETDDGSYTLYNSEYGEHYHSLSGAAKEALARYAIPCRIKDLAMKPEPIRILDIGFGLGWNLLSSLKHARDAAPQCRIEVVSLEKSLLAREYLHKIWTNFDSGRWLPYLESLLDKGEVDLDGILLQLRLGPAEQEVKEVGQFFDAIYLDPFSPSKNAELWQAEFLSDLYSCASERAILSTYSVATRVKVALLQAGWEIFQGPRVGKKASGTIAAKQQMDPPLVELPPREIRKLRRKATLRDEGHEQDQDEAN